MSARSDQLVSSVQSYLRAHDEWARDNNRPNPDPAYWTALDDLCDAFDAGSIPGDCRDLASAVAKINAEYDVWDNNGDPQSPMPHDAFWMARESLAKTLLNKVAFQMPPLESLQQLRDQKVPDLQICKIYGFINKYDQPMPWLIDQELKKPDSVLKTPGAIDGRDWEDPRVTARRKAGEEEAVATESHVEHKTAVPTTAKPCPESPLDLYQQNVSVAQAAKMLVQPEEKVREVFELFDSVSEAGESLEEAWATEKETFFATAEKPVEKKRSRASRATKEPANA